VKFRVPSVAPRRWEATMGMTPGEWKGAKVETRPEGPWPPGDVCRGRWMISWLWRNTPTSPWTYCSATIEAYPDRLLPARGGAEYNEQMAFERAQATTAFNRRFKGGGVAKKSIFFSALSQNDDRHTLDLVYEEEETGRSWRRELAKITGKAKRARSRSPR